MLLVSTIVLVSPAEAASRGVELTGAFPRTISPVGQNETTFRTVRVDIDYRGGPVRLSSTADGTGRIVTDDAMTLVVKKGKTTQPPLAIDFSRNCVGLESRPPQDVSGLFRRGVNQVTLMLHDRCGVAYSSEPYFLVGDVTARNPSVEGQLGRGTNPGTFGDPVNTAIGNFHREETDLAFAPSVYGMDLVRTYNARDNEISILGQGWSTSFEASVIDEDGGAVSFRDSDGRTILFTPDGGRFRPSVGFFGELGRAADGTITIDWPGQETWRFDAQGRLVEKRNWDGQAVVITFEGDRLTSVGGARGASLAFVYDDQGVLTSITTSDGRSVRYRHDAGGLLVAATDAMDATTTYGYDGAGRLSSVRDADGVEVVSLTYDDDGRVIEQRNSDGGQSTFQYDEAGHTTTVADESTGTKLAYEHDADGQLQRLTDPFGASATRAYDPAGNLISAGRRSGSTVRQTFDDRGNVTSRAVGGSTVAFAYDDLNRVVSSTDAMGAITRYAYEGQSRVLASRIDPSGGITRFESTDGRITAITDPDRVTTRFSHDATGNVVAVTDGAGATTRYEYDSVGRRVAAITPLGFSQRSVFDTAGRLLSTSDGAGATTRFRYSPAGRLLEMTDPVGARTTFTYDDRGRLTSEIDPIGRATAYAYDDAGNVTARTDPDGSMTRFEYDALSRLIAETDPLGVVSRRSYGPDGEELSNSEGDEKTTVELDERGNVIAAADAAGAVTRSTYDLANRLIAEMDPTGAERRIRYDAAGRVVAETDPTGATTLRRWTAAGRLSEVEDPLGRITRYGYDGAGRLSTVTDPAQGTTRYEYDRDGRRVAETSPAGLITRIGFDAEGRKVSATSPSGIVETTEYSLRGEPVAIRNASGATVRMEYDPAGQLTSVTDPNGGITRYAYDQAGRRVSQTDARGGATRYGYDRLGREVERTDPLGRTTRRRYDAGGRLSATVLATGETAERTYDPAGRLTAITAGGKIIRYAYDAAGRRVSMQDGIGTTAYRHDPAGRLAEVIEPDGATYRHTYDAAGQLVGITYPSGLQVTRRYNAAGRLVRLEQASVRHQSAGITAPQATLPKTIAWHHAGSSGEPAAFMAGSSGSSPSEPFTVSFDLDPDGRLLGETISGGTTRRYGYRAGLLATFSERPTGHPGRETRSTVLDRDRAGRVIKETTDGHAVQFAYDLAGQLTAVDGGQGASQRFEYDATGNRTTLITADVEVRYRYDAAHQLEEATAGKARTRFTFDAAGRLVGLDAPNATSEWSYDPFGRLATETRSTAGVTTRRSMEYDGNDLLRLLADSTSAGRSDPTPTVTQRFDWSQQSDVPEVMTRKGSAGDADFVYGYGRALMVAPSGPAAFSSDVYGSALRTPPTRPAALALGYDIFGVPTPDAASAPGGALFGYRGELTIGDEIYLRARHYLPALGRFSSIDPEEGVPGTTTLANPYHYADNDPVNRIDPTGRRATDDDMRAPVDYGRARFRTVGIRFSPQQGRGTVRVGLYIPTETAGLPGVNALRSHGDNRGPSPYADLSRHRAVATVDYEAGRANFRINPSCGLGGPPGDCHDPLPIIDNFSTFPRLFQKVPLFVKDSNRVKLEAKRGGRLKIRWAILNSDKRVVAPSIDGSVTLHPLGPRAICIEYHRDAYPALEAYQFRAGRPPTDLLHQNAAWNADRGLLPLPFTDRDGTTCPSKNEFAPGPIGRPGGGVA